MTIKFKLETEAAALIKHCAERQGESPSIVAKGWILDRLQDLLDEGELVIEEK